ncbi:MAG: porin family protein [bacterium]|nr:porin family protein [bacterium]
MKRLALAVFVAGLSTAAFAADKSTTEHPYLGIDYQRGTFKLDSGDSANPSAIRLRAGTELNPYFAVEAQGAIGVGDDTLSLPGVDYTIKLNGLYGLYVRPQISFAGQASVYALLGYSYVQVQADSAALPTKRDWNSGTSFGGGVDVDVYDGIRLSVDYMDYLKGYTAVSAGIRIPIK